MIVKPKEKRIDPRAMPSGLVEPDYEPNDSPDHDKNIQMIDEMFLKPPLQNDTSAFDYFDVNARRNN